MMVLTLVAMMALAASDPLAGQGPATVAGIVVPATPPAKPPPPKGDPQEVVCEDRPQIGSVIPRHICATRAQWEKRARRDQEELRRQNDPGGGIPD